MDISEYVFVDCMLVDFSISRLARVFVKRKVDQVANRIVDHPSIRVLRCWRESGVGFLGICRIRLQTVECVSGV